MKNHLLAAALAAMLALGLAGCEEKKQRPQPSPSDASEALSAAPASDGLPSAPAPAESSADRALLLSFLDGETHAVVGDDFYDDLSFICYNAFDGVERFDFQALNQMAVDSFDYLELDSLQAETSYALVKTLGGREMLAVECRLPDTPDGHWAYFIFGVYGQEVRLTYAKDSWSRSDTRLHQGLIFDGGGSAGAGDHYTWYGYIDETGHYCSVYEMEILDGPWVAMYAYEIFDDTDWAAGCACYLLTTDEGEFYELSEGEDADPEKLALLRQYLEEQGKAEVSDVEEMIAAAKDDHGLEETEAFEDWTPWEAKG